VALRHVLTDVSVRNISIDVSSAMNAFEEFTIQNESKYVSNAFLIGML
jgi:hypothetical protein